MLLYTTFLILVNILLSKGGRPEVKCPVPVSPTNGQTFVSRLGTSVKFSCNPGYELIGSQVAICKENRWYPETPICKPVKSNQLDMMSKVDSDVTASSSRPLFKWDSNEIDDEEKNDTMQQDGARYHMVLYPRSRLITQSNRVRSASELKEEEKKRKSSGTTQRPTTSPGVVYVRRSWPYYQGVPVQVVTDNNEVVEANEKAYQYYWESHYPRRAVRYEAAQPIGLSLSESQLAWINNLHPELRDRYLKDLYDMRANELNYYAYDDRYRWRNPYYTRQPVAVVAEDPVAMFDYSCHRTERDGRVVTIRAPKLPNAYIYRYDRRKNSYHPYNDYLIAQYRCKAGYTLLNPNTKELFCSRSSWVGNSPVCVPKP